MSISKSNPYLDAMEARDPKAIVHISRQVGKTSFLETAEDDHRTHLCLEMDHETIRQRLSEMYVDVPTPPDTHEAIPMLRRRDMNLGTLPQTPSAPDESGKSDADIVRLSTAQKKRERKNAKRKREMIPHT